MGKSSTNGLFSTANCQTARGNPNHQTTIYIYGWNHTFAVSLATGHELRGRVSRWFATWARPAEGRMGNMSGAGCEPKLGYSLYLTIVIFKYISKNMERFWARTRTLLWIPLHGYGSHSNFPLQFDPNYPTISHDISMCQRLEERDGASIYVGQFQVGCGWNPRFNGEMLTYQR